MDGIYGIFFGQHCLALTTALYFTELYTAHLLWDTAAFFYQKYCTDGSQFHISTRTYTALHAVITCCHLLIIYRSQNKHSTNYKDDQG